MKNLGRTIDRLLKIDSDLGKDLKPIKNKWKRYPNKTEDYWKELLDFLNTDTLMQHPKRTEMRNVLYKRKRVSSTYSFERLTSQDSVIGVIPGNLADRIRRRDLQSIRLAKQHLEANMTHNISLMAQVMRKEQILEIGTKKLWVDLRDHFQLWKRPGNYNIKLSEYGVLYLVEPMSSTQFIGPGMIRMDPKILKKFFKFLGIEPPPDLSNGDQ